MKIEELKPKTKRSSANRVGRGGKRGKTSGKGHKGQKARAGHKIRPEIRDMIKKLPKLRGRGVNSNKGVGGKNEVVNLSQIALNFKSGEKVNPASLYEKGLVRKKSGKLPTVKILGVGEVSDKINITDCQVSAVAREKIEKAGGSVA